MGTCGQQFNKQAVGAEHRWAFAFVTSRLNPVCGVRAGLDSSWVCVFAIRMTITRHDIPGASHAFFTLFCWSRVLTNLSCQRVNMQTHCMFVLHSISLSCSPGPGTWLPCKILSWKTKFSHQSTFKQLCYRICRLKMKVKSNVPNIRRNVSYMWKMEMLGNGKLKCSGLTAKTRSGATGEPLSRADWLCIQQSRVLYGWLSSLIQWD